MTLKLQPFLPSGFDPREGRHLLKETIDLAWPATFETGNHDKMKNKR